MAQSPLDDRQTYAKQDPAGLHARIAGLPDQMTEAYAAAGAVALPPEYAAAKRIAVLGMGGSGIGGSLLRALAIDAGATTPVDIVRGYTLPAYVDGQTLAIASSNSGNTEEVVSLLQQARTRGAMCVAMSTGGGLLQFARDKDIPALVYEWQGEPRSALGWSFASLLGICGGLRLIPDASADLAAAVEGMRAVVAACGIDAPEGSNAAKQLARRLHDRVPVIAGADALAPVAYRWRTQINENAKQWGVALELPEMNHNAPVGYAGPSALVPLLHAVLLRRKDEHPRIAARTELSRQQLEAAGVAVEVIETQGASALEQMLWAVQLGDFASYYLGILNGADPSEVQALDWLKRRLAAD
jgi:glucose/mannose-6-phosphate isomerase